MSEFKKYNFFRPEEANKNFNFWINNDPEYFRPLDLQMFTDMVISVLDNGEQLEYTHLNQAESRLTELKKEIYMEKYFAMKAIYDKLQCSLNPK